MTGYRWWWDASLACSCFMGTRVSVYVVEWEGGKKRELEQNWAEQVSCSKEAGAQSIFQRPCMLY